MTLKDVYAELPRDAYDNAAQIVPETVPHATTLNTAGATITLNSSTGLVELQAFGGQGVFVNYSGTTPSSSDFDEFVQDGHVRHYSVPKDVTQITIALNNGGSYVVIEK